MLVTKIGNIVLPEPRTYIAEVEGFEANGFPIANRKDDISALLRRIAYSRYPNFAILGPSGIGKTMSIDYIVDLITGKIELDEDDRWQPLVQRIQERAKEYQKKDFLFLPNLQNPFEPYALDYVGGKIKQAEEQANVFCRELVSFFQQIGQRKEVHPSFTEEEFREYVEDSANHIYQTLYEQLAAVTPHPAEFKVTIGPSFHRYTFSLKFLEKKIPYQQIRKEIGIRGKKESDVIKSALKKQLRFEIKASMMCLFKEVNDIKIEGLGKREKRDIVTEIFDDVYRDYQGISSLFRKNEFEYYSALRQRQGEGGIGLRISPQSIDWCIAELKGMRERYARGADPKLENWMRFVIEYFTSNRKTLSSLILEHYKRVNQYAYRMGQKAIGLFCGALILSPEKESSDLAFKIQHGKHEIALRDVLAPHAYTQSSESGELCVRHPRDITKQALLGEISNAETKEDEDEDDFYWRRKPKKKVIVTPPHLRFKPGYLVDSSVLVMPDNLQAFFRALLGTEKKEAEARRQTILTYFQSGDLVYQEKGVTFKIHCPTIVIGSDNELPFLKKSIEKEDEYEPDEAMTSRFVVAQWDSYAPNTPEARRGTIAVICKALDDFNQDNQTSLKFSSEVTDWFLVSSVNGDSLSVNYRTLDKDVRAVLEWAKSRDIEEVSLSTIKDYNKSNEPRNRFSLVNARHESMIAQPPKSISGAIYGVAFQGMSVMADLFPVRSKVIPDKARENQPNFCAYDLDAKLVSPSTIKGYDEAVGFLRSQLEEPSRFIVNTSFHRNIFQVAGNSASLAIALSLWSAITGEDLYQNRVFTGTVSFFDGSVGPIGGVYDKGLAVWRWHHLMNGRNPEDYFFIYPAENHRELAQSAATSPFSLEETVMIPVTSFQEALYLATAEKIEPDMFESLPEKAKEHFQKSRAKLVEGVREINKRVAEAYK